jgi:hypothetical protein
MKIFTQNSYVWGDKINFADENNVSLGYNLGQDCCEYADWFIDDTPWQTRLPKNISNYQKTEGYDGWVFDTNFQVLIESHKDLDEGGIAIFKITKDGAEKYIHIFNSHNGYYGHGFNFTIGETVLEKGIL